MSESGPKYLEIKVGDVVLELLSLGDMPALKVMDMLKSKDDKLEKSLELMKLASRNPKEFEIEREYMSFNELLLAIDVWLEKSSKDTENSKRRLMKKEKDAKRDSAKSNSHSHSSSKEIEMITEMIERAVEALIPDDADIELEVGTRLVKSDDGDSYQITDEDFDLEAVMRTLKNSGLEINSETPEHAIRKVAMWFVVNGHANELIENGMLTKPNRSGTYYPIIDGVTKRRLGFTLEQAKEQYKNEQ